MGNIKNYKFDKLDVRLSNSDYWDFYLANDDSSGGGPSIITTGDCFVVAFDFNNPEIYSTSGATSANTISSYVWWTGATNSGYTFSTIGLTGIDNGLVTFQKDPLDPTNQALLSALTGTTLFIPANDKRLHLNRVTGTTGNFIYPIDILNDVSGDYAQLCGGFYQGYYKIDGSTYEVLPKRMHKAWAAEFWLKRDEEPCTGYTDTILNDMYPNNKGFFFYMGTRAENKFWNRFEGADTGCTSACTVSTGCTDPLSPWCTIPKETDIFIGSGSTAIPLYPSQTITTEITNPFLIYGRASASGGTRCQSCGGDVSGFGTETVCSYDGKPITITTPKTVKTNNQNPFLIYGRASASGGTRCQSCGGDVSGFGNQTICSFSGFDESIQFEDIDYNVDIIDNAIGFRITDDGRIGYRLLTFTGQCSGTTYISGITIEEAYSEPNVVPESSWQNVVIRYTMDDYYDDCQLRVKPKRKGKLMFYVNARLKFVARNINEIVGRRLEEHMEKQVGVPFNMSLGGGSQGLIETQTFDGRDLKDLGLPIEQNFAGTFIGAISQFNFYICDLYFTNIQNIYINGVIRYYPTYTNLILQENGYWVLQENAFAIEWE